MTTARRIRPYRLVGTALMLAVALGEASAALAPEYQRRAEMEAVIRVAAETLEDPIDRVEHYGDDKYRVWGGRCWMEVTIVGIPQQDGLVGPKKFEAQAGEVECDIPVND